MRPRAASSRRTIEPTYQAMRRALLAGAAALVAAVCAGALAAPAGGDPSPRRPPHDSWLIARVKPGATVTLRTRPAGKIVARVGRRTFFGSLRVFTVFRVRGPWLGVSTPELPNHRLAWIDGRRGLSFARTRLSLRADLSRRRLVLLRGSDVLRSVTVGTGRPPSTTPVGRFSVTDKLKGPRYGPYYGCCILAISGNQQNLPPGWIGGSRLAIHGTPNPATLGERASAGCLHATRLSLLYLIRSVPLGTPVFIHP
jgi:hypothetical protein